MLSAQVSHTVFWQNVPSVDLRLLEAILDALNKIIKISRSEEFHFGDSLFFATTTPNFFASPPITNIFAILSPKNFTDSPHPRPNLFGIVATKNIFLSQLQKIFIHPPPQKLQNPTPIFFANATRKTLLPPQPHFFASTLCSSSLDTKKYQKHVQFSEFQSKTRLHTPHVTYKMDSSATLHRLTLHPFKMFNLFS